MGKWTNDYKAYLLKMQNKGDIDSFIEDHTTTTVSFIVSMKSVQLTRMMKAGLEKVFKLDGNMPLTNMNAFDSNISIQKYESPEGIVNDYFPIRLGLYHDRKEALESSKEYSAALVRNKARFIEEVVDGKVDLVRGNKTKLDTVNQLEELDFVKLTSLESILTRSKASAKMNTGTSDDNAHSQDDDLHDEKGELKQYDYLLNMPLSSLTAERIESLRAEADKTETELDSIRKATPEQLWHGDLDNLDDYLKKKMNH